MNPINIRKSSITVKDVAKQAGVAVGTVSRYLNGYTLRPDKRERVQKAINELGFKGNFLARGLKKKCSMTIGALTSGFTEIFSLSIINAFSKTIEMEGYSLILSDYEGNSDKFIQKLRFLNDRYIDGLVVFPTFSDEKALVGLNELLKEQIPVILINEIIEGVHTDCVIVDNANTSFRAVEHLIHANHTKIAIICGFEEDYVSLERLRGYREALQVYNIPENDKYIKYGRYSNKGGYLAAMELLQNPDPPTALYITNYGMTNGALMAIRELNINIPEQLSVIGFDYTEFTDLIKPTLTVVKQPTEKMGEIAAQIMLKRIKGDFSDFPKKLQINTALLLRDSVRKL